MTRRSLAVLAALAGLASAEGLLPTPVRSFGAGGTGVVTASGGEALLLNPSRLALEGTDVGIDDALPREAGGWELSGTLGARNPGKVADQVLEHWRTLRQSNLDTALARDPALFDALWDLDRQAVGLRPEARLDLHRPGFGLALWGIADLEATGRHGELYPSGTLADTLSAGAQVGVARALVRNELMVGAALKSVWGTSWRVRASAREGLQKRDTVLREARREFTLENVEWAAGTDLGVTWLPVERVQLGTSLRDLGMWYRGDFLVPRWDLGAAWLPEGFQSEGEAPGHLALAVALVDLLDDRQGWKPGSKLALGADCAFSPMRWRSLNFRTSVGLLGGYPTAGLGIDLLRALHLDLLTWAREAGWYTGQRPDRKWVLRGGLGW